MSASSGAVLGTYSVGTDAVSAAYDGANVWVAGYASGNVTKLRASDGVVLGTFTVGGSPQAVMFDGTNIWASVNTATAAEVVELRVSDGAILSTVVLGSTYQCPPYPPGCSGTGCQTPPANVPRASGLAFDSTHVWVSNLQGCSVSKL
jgi:hypothetical protein